MRSDSDIAVEALRRGVIILEKRGRKRARLKAWVVTGACLCLTAAVAVIPGAYGRADCAPAQAAVTMLNGAFMGGNILSGLTGFLLGAAVVLFYRRRGKTDEKQKSKQEEQ